MKNNSDFKEMYKNAIILFVITLIAGVALGFVNELTKEPIAYQQELKIQKACAAVFAEAASFEAITENSVEEVLAEIQTNGTTIGTVYQAFAADGSLMGYVISTSSSEGYGGAIELMMGVKLDGTVNGVSILSIAETPGLGMQADEILIPQFSGKNVEAFVYTKSGAAADNEIDAISGATVTTSAVTNAVNTGLTYFQLVLQEGGNKS